MATNISKLEKTVAVMSNDIEYIKKGIDDLRETVKGYATHHEVGDLERRIARVEGAIVWATRLTVGAVITAVLGLVLTMV